MPAMALKAEGIGSSCNATGRIVVDYDALGDITNKSDICWTSGGCYTYGGSGAGPHAVTAIVSTDCSSQNPGCLVNGIANPGFRYDADGNMTCTRANGTGNCDATAARWATWTSFNVAASISQAGSPLYALTYGPEHDRTQQCVPNCASPTSTTLYM